MSLITDCGSLITFSEELEKVQCSLNIVIGESGNKYKLCQQKYYAISSELQQLCRTAFNRMEYEQSAVMQCERECNQVMSQMGNVESEEDTQAFQTRFEIANENRIRASQRADEARAELELINEKQKKLGEKWNDFNSCIAPLIDNIETESSDFNSLTITLKDEISQACEILQKAEKELNGDTHQSGNSANPPVGQQNNNSIGISGGNGSGVAQTEMAVSGNSDTGVNSGQFSINISGSEKTYPYSAEGITAAYQAAFDACDYEALTKAGEMYNDFITGNEKGNSDGSTSGNANAEADSINGIRVFPEGYEKSSGVSNALFFKLPGERRKAMDKTFTNLPDNIASELNSHASQLNSVIGAGMSRDEYGCPVKNGSSYSPSESIIRMEDGISDEQYAEELPHELMHFLDFKRGNDSSKPEFVEAYKKDMAIYDRSTLQGQANFHEMMLDLVSTEAGYDRAVSDFVFGFFGENGNDREIYDVFTKNGIIPFSHSDDYWMGIKSDGYRDSDGGESVRRCEMYAEIGTVRSLGRIKSNHFLERHFPSMFKAFSDFYSLN